MTITEQLKKLEERKAFYQSQLKYTQFRGWSYWNIIEKIAQIEDEMFALELKRKAE